VANSDNFADFDERILRTLELEDALAVNIKDFAQHAEDQSKYIL
jgi:hypothetical protein